ADRATDWRGNNNIAESIFEQLSLERHPVPRWIVVGAGTGGTSATIGRYLRYRRYDSDLAVVDPENSAFFPSWRDADMTVTTGGGSRIEGIGRPRVEPSFQAGVVDRMISVPDAASIATARAVEPLLGRRVGPSTGTNLWGVLHIAAEMRQRGEAGSIVTLLCDGGERYAHTYYNDAWLAEQGLDLAPYAAQLAALLN
ncbi:MAG: pyridoxal-phosphate dependent enzyme, partial [Jatrophihabitantaceae bacterium]